MEKTTNLTRESVLVCSEDILASDLGTEKVMMSIEHGRYYGLNEIGKLIHDGCDGKANLGDIVTSLLEKFDVDAETCERKVLFFASTLVNSGLLAPAND